MAWKNVQYENGKYRTSSGGGGGSSTFADLEDVDLSNLQDGQVPKYNATTQKWENANESGSGTITDVEVNGVSVVNQQGVAEINVPKRKVVTHDWGTVTSGTRYSYDITADYPEINADSFWSFSSSYPSNNNNADGDAIMTFGFGVSLPTHVYIQYNCRRNLTNASSKIVVLYS